LQSTMMEDCKMCSVHTCQVYRFDRESPDFRHVYRSTDRVFYLSSFSRFNKKSLPKIPTRRFAATSNIKTWKCLFLPIDGAVTKALRALSTYAARYLSYVYPGTSQGEPWPAPFWGTQRKKQVTIKQQRQLFVITDHGRKEEGTTKEETKIYVQVSRQMDGRVPVGTLFLSTAGLSYQNWIIMMQYFDIFSIY